MNKPLSNNLNISMHKIPHLENQSSNKKQINQEFANKSSPIFLNENLRSKDLTDLKLLVSKSKTNHILTRKLKHFFNVSAVEKDLSIISFKNILAGKFFQNNRKIINLSLTASKFIDCLIQMFFKSRVNCEINGEYIFKKDSELIKEIGWKNYQSCTKARKELLEQGFIKIERKYYKGINHYKLNLKKIYQAIFEQIGSEGKGILSNQMWINISQKAFNVYKNLGYTPLKTKVEIKNCYLIKENLYNSNSIGQIKNLDVNKFKNSGEIKKATDFIPFNSRIFAEIWKRSHPDKRFCVEYYEEFIRKIIKSEFVSENQLIARCVAWGNRQFTNKLQEKGLEDVRPIHISQKKLRNKILGSKKFFEKIHSKLPDNKKFSEDYFINFVQKNYESYETISENKLIARCVGWAKIEKREVA